MVDQILRDAGYETFIQDRDFGPTAFTERMDHGMKMVETGAVIVALVSGTYLNKDYCMVEALYPLRRDPFNKQRRLVVLRIAECEPEGLLGPIPSVDLVPHLHDATAVKRLVLGAVDPGRFPKEADFAALQRRAARQTIHPEVRPLAGLAARPDEMVAIDAALWKGDGGRAALTNSVGATAAVKGLGGVGKSVLARGYAWENRARYHGVWWLRAQSPDTILDDLIELGCRIVNPDLREWPDPRAAAQAVLDAIAQQTTEKPWLLVYDNAEAPEGVRELIPPAGAHALLTTRWQDWYGEATEVRVGVFPRETATEYLMAQARGGAEQPVETRAAAARLAEDLGFLPLALALAPGGRLGPQLDVRAVSHAHRRDAAARADQGGRLSELRLRHVHRGARSRGRIRAGGRDADGPVRLPRPRQHPARSRRCKRNGRDRQGRCRRGPGGGVAGHARPLPRWRAVARRAPSYAAGDEGAARRPGGGGRGAGGGDGRAGISVRQRRRTVLADVRAAGGARQGGAGDGAGNG